MAGMEFNDRGCLFFIGCTIALITFIPTFMWLNVVNSNETLIKPSIQNFFLTPLINTNSLNISHTIFFNLQLKDDTYDVGVYYDNSTLNFFFVGVHPSIIPIATYKFPGFYQKGDEHGSVVHVSDHVETTQAIPMIEITRNETLFSEMDVMVFRVELETVVMFKYGLWKSKRYGLNVKGDVQVDIISGRKVGKKEVELKSSHSSGGHYTTFIVFCTIFWMLLSIAWVVSICFTCKFR